MADLLFKLASKIPVLRNIQQVYGERNALRHLYANDNEKSLIPGKYYRYVDSGSGNTKGISFVCHCGQEFRLFSMFECFRQGYACPGCKTPINVLKHVGAIDAAGKFLVKVQELESLLSKLTVRPVGVSGDAGPRFVDTWNDGSGADGWDGHRVSGRQQAFDSGDPGICGPGF